MSKCARGSDSRSSFVSLPAELLQLVLGSLGVLELALRLRPVCRQARALAARQRSVGLQTRELQDGHLQALCSGLDLSCLVSLRLRLAPGLALNNLPVLSPLPALEELWLSGQGLSNRGLQAVLRAAPRLQSLKLTRCYCLTGDVFEAVARLSRIRCLWWPRSMSQGLWHLAGARLTEFGLRYAFIMYEAGFMARWHVVFSNVQRLELLTLHPGAELPTVLERMPRLTLLRIKALLLAGTLEMVNECALGLFESCPSLERFETRSRCSDRSQTRELGGLKLWLREADGRVNIVQFYAEYGPWSGFWDGLSAICKPLEALEEKT